MATAIELAEQIAALEDAIASGAVHVRFGERDVTYRSLDEMNRVLSGLRTRQAALAGKSSRPRASFVQFSRGL